MRQKDLDEYWLVFESKEGPVKELEFLFNKNFPAIFQVSLIYTGFIDSINHLIVII